MVNDTAVAMPERIPEQAGTDYRDGKTIIMDSLGRIFLGWPAKPSDCLDHLSASGAVAQFVIAVARSQRREAVDGEIDQRDQLL